MNFLQLVSRLRRKCRVAGANPVTLQGNTVEEVARLIDWINEAWMDIQLLRPDWYWMRESVVVNTVQAQPTYSLADCGVSTNFGNWKTDTFRNYPTTTGNTGEIFMFYIDYESWRNRYQYGAIRYGYTRPIEFSVAPDMSICLGPPPISGYTFTGDYFTVATEMVGDDDTPALPSQFHMAIVYKAMMYYGASEAAPEVYQEGELEFKRMMNRIARRELPEIMLPGALA